MITITITPYNTKDKYPDRVLFISGGKISVYWQILKIVYAMYRTYGISILPIQDHVDSETIYIVDSNNTTIMAITVEDSTPSDDIAYAN